MANAQLKDIWTLSSRSSARPNAQPSSTVCCRPEARQEQGSKASSLEFKSPPVL